MREKQIVLWGAPTLDWLNVIDPSNEKYDWQVYSANSVNRSVRFGGVSRLKKVLKDFLEFDPVEIVIPWEGEGESWDQSHPIEINKQNEGMSVEIEPSMRNHITLWDRYIENKGKKDEFEAYRAKTISKEKGNFTLKSPMEKIKKSIPTLLVIDDPNGDRKYVEGKGNDKKEKDYNETEIIDLDWLSDAPPDNLEIILALNNSHAKQFKETGIGSPLILDELDENEETKQWKKKITILTNLNHLRGSEEPIVKSVSWERIFEDVCVAVEKRFFPRRKEEECQFARVIVNIGLSGAVIVTRNDENDIDCDLLYNQSSQEGDFELKYKGHSLGYGTCMLAALSCAWVEGFGNEKEERGNWLGVTKVGTIMARSLQKRGYILVKKPLNRPRLVFPIEELKRIYYNFYSPSSLNAKKIADKEEFNEWQNSFDSELLEWKKDFESFGEFSEELENVKKLQKSAQDQTNKENKYKWTLFSERLNQDGHEDGEKRDKVYQLAEKIVKIGPQKALQAESVPIHKIGRWLSVDRDEIESVRALQNAIGNYLAQRKHQSDSKFYERSEEKPLSIAVFGKPGSGKSFVVKEIARELGFDEEAQITINLSQYESPKQLTKAFQSIRDLRLRGLIPLVFWDEFDSGFGEHSSSWLRYFLSPMQDGLYNDEGKLHPVGAAVYVFAGGTNCSFEKFVKDLKIYDENENENESDKKDKKPDFVSRLKVYIDIQSSNKKPEDKSNFYLIRRALLLRNCLEQSAKGIMRDICTVDSAVLNFFFNIEKYIFEARSLEAIVHLSDLAEKRKFEISSLPPKDLLEMHVIGSIELLLKGGVPND